MLPLLSYSSILMVFLKQVTELEPVTPLRQSGALANYAIPAYKSFPVGNVSKLT